MSKLMKVRVQRLGIEQSSTTPDPGYQWESDKLTVGTTNENQEVSPFTAGDHKAHTNRRAQRHSKHKTKKKHKKINKRSTALERSVKYSTGGLKRLFHFFDTCLIYSRVIGLQASS